MKQELTVGQKISLALKGNKNGRGNKGKKFTEERKLSMSKSLIGRKLSEKTKDKLSQYWTNRKRPKASGENHWNWKGSFYGRRKIAKLKPKVIKSGMCEVCGSDKRIVYDHNHITGIFRGWLCNNCNVALGMVRDNPSTLKLLVAYIESKS